MRANLQTKIVKREQATNEASGCSVVVVAAAANAPAATAVATAALHL